MMSQKRTSSKQTVPNHVYSALPPTSLMTYTVLLKETQEHTSQKSWTLLPTVHPSRNYVRIISREWVLPNLNKKRERNATITETWLSHRLTFTCTVAPKNGGIKRTKSSLKSVRVISQIRHSRSRYGQNAPSNHVTKTIMNPHHVFFFLI